MKNNNSTLKLNQEYKDKFESFDGTNQQNVIPDNSNLIRGKMEELRRKEILQDCENAKNNYMSKLIRLWQVRQKYYEDLAEEYKNDEHSYKKFTYKAMATRDCWKELLNYIKNE